MGSQKLENYKEMVGKRVIFRYVRPGDRGEDTSLIHEVQVLEYVVDREGIDMLKIREEQRLHTGLYLQEYWIRARELDVRAIIQERDKAAPGLLIENKFTQ